MGRNQVAFPCKGPDNYTCDYRLAIVACKQAPHCEVHSKMIRVSRVHYEKEDPQAVLYLLCSHILFLPYMHPAKVIGVKRIQCSSFPESPLFMGLRLVFTSTCSDL